MPNEITASLPELADRINAAHVRAEGAINDALASAREAGRLLLEAKRQVGHGEWTGWVESNFRGSDRTARAYMRVAKEWGQIEAANRQTSANLSIDAALRLIATPRDDELESDQHFRSMTEAEAVAVQERVATEDWLDAWRERLLSHVPEPSPDRCLFGRSGDWRALIEPSAHPPKDKGPFYYVTVFGPELDFVSGTKKPVIADLIAFYIDDEHPDEGRFELEGSSWTILPAGERPRFNHWLFDSHEDYIQRAILGRGEEDHAET